MNIAHRTVPCRTLSPQIPALEFLHRTLRRKYIPLKSETKTSVSRAVFKWLSKLITWLRLLRLVVGLKDSRQFFNQWESKPKPIAPCTRDFSRASSELQVRSLLLLWLVKVIALVLVFRQSFENRSITEWSYFLMYLAEDSFSTNRGDYKSN